MVEQLKKVLTVLEDEIKNGDSVWSKQQLLSVVKPEIEELYQYFVSGKLFFKYGKKQRMLESTYIITESLKKLKDTNLGREIIKLQELYYKL